MEKFACGLVLGCIGGALLTANNYKMRTLVRKTQEEMKAKFDKMIDEKIQAAEELTEEIKESAEKAAETVAEKSQETLNKVKKVAKKAK
ncbi:MAG: hypothetical protein IJV83_02710 [Clostridia bacterium]|nr:hypothetical protein [Clostridia bacterium]